MKGYIYKVVIFAIAIIIVFEFTIGKQINNFNQKINYLTTKEGRKEILLSLKRKLKKQMKRRIIWMRKRECFYEILLIKLKMS